MHINFFAEKSRNDLAEFKELAKSSGTEIVGIVVGKRDKPDPKYFVGSGKAKEIADLVLTTEAELVITNDELTPAQERNLEALIKCRVLDRTGLILDIFARRARSFEGRLQVELAQLEHLSTRLVRGWTHLERQKGGIGLRGPGETQLEVDRRLIRNRIKVIKGRLEKVLQRRQQSRRARRRSEIPTISLVGYTNAGKSTLFNMLTSADIYAADQLFATLDPTLRKIHVPGFGAVVLADTVGFIHNLPHELISAFHATLEESKEADLLLHIVDISDQERRDKIKAVKEVLREIGAENNRQLLVFNKLDLTQHLPEIIYVKNEPKSVKISAAFNNGVDLLLESVQELLTQGLSEQELVLTPMQGELRAKLYREHIVLGENIDEHGNYVIRILTKLKSQ